MLLAPDVETATPLLVVTLAPAPVAMRPVALSPLVETEPPLIVVVPPAPVTTPWALAPLVEIVEVTSDSVPPEVSVEYGPL